ncbi:carbohydrate kinase family protein [Candidatus Gracilibacteria bacterium]|nr:carbohydrate kinase family protein [Candidatus Gracilibacteria bacterium]
MKKKDILVCGSIAYDVIFNYDRNFQDALRTDSDISVAFNVQNKQTFFGGCSGNIVYWGKKIDADFSLFGLAGKDFGPYQEHLENAGIDTSDVMIDAELFTSQAVITTDKKNQQIIFFYEGATSAARKYEKAIQGFFKKHSAQTSLAHIAPNNPVFVSLCAQACVQNNLPYFFDPGQATAAFESSELKQLLENSAGFFCNEYELGLFLEKTHMKKKQLLDAVPLVVVTRAEKGSTIFWHGEPIEIPVSKPKRIVDPTGCGDAYRAGFLATIEKSWPKLNTRLLYKAGIKGSQLAAQCIMKAGPH